MRYRGAVRCSRTRAGVWGQSVYFAHKNHSPARSAAAAEEAMSFKPGEEVWAHTGSEASFEKGSVVSLIPNKSLVQVKLKGAVFEIKESDVHKVRQGRSARGAFCRPPDARAEESAALAVARANIC